MNQRQSDYFASVREKYNICHKCSSFRDYKNDGLCIQCDKEEKEVTKKIEDQAPIIETSSTDIVNPSNKIRKINVGCAVIRNEDKKEGVIKKIILLAKHEKWIEIRVESRAEDVFLKEENFYNHFQLAS